MWDLVANNNQPVISDSCCDRLKPVVFDLLAWQQQQRLYNKIYGNTGEQKTEFKWLGKIDRAEEIIQLSNSRAMVASMVCVYEPGDTALECINQDVF